MDHTADPISYNVFYFYWILTLKFELTSSLFVSSVPIKKEIEFEPYVAVVARQHGTHP